MELSFKNKLNSHVYVKKKTTTQLSFLEWASASHPASFLVPGVWVYPLRRQCLRSKDFTSGSLHFVQEAPHSTPLAPGPTLSCLSAQ